MSVRRERKTKKYLGTRTRGAGNTKHRRGKGSRGGTGFTGKFGHKKSKFFHMIGINSKNKSRTITKPITFNMINVYLDKLSKTDVKEPFVLDFLKNKELKKYNKLICKGKLNYKVVIKGISLSENAKKEVENKGGSIE